MSQPPSTPVKVPSAATNYTAATLDPDLRSQINSALLKEGHITKIQDALLHSLNANPRNWPSSIQSHALSLLRSGEITTYPALLSRVLDDVRADTVSSLGGSTNGKVTNGDAKRVNGTGGGTEEKQSLEVPPSVIEEALKVARESLEAVCKVDESGTG